MVLYDKSGEEHFNLISALHKSVRSSRCGCRAVLAGSHAGRRRGPHVHRAAAGANGDRGYRPGRSAGARTMHRGAAGGTFSGGSGRRSGAGAGGDLSGGRAEVGRGLSRAECRDARRSQKTMAEPVPMQLRNAPTRPMKEWGYGAGYQHAHQFEDAINTMECLPDSAARDRVLRALRARGRGADSRAPRRDPEKADCTDPGIELIDYLRAVMVISMCAPPESFMTPTVVRVGRGSLKIPV